MEITNQQQEMFWRNRFGHKNKTKTVDQNQESTRLLQCHKLDNVLLQA